MGENNRGVEKISRKRTRSKGKQSMTKRQALLGRKSVEKTELFKLLTTHLAQNWDCSKDQFESGSENEEDVSTACKRRLQSSSVKQSYSKEVIAYQITEAQGAEPAGKDSSGTNKREHNVGIPEPPARNSEDECQLNSSVYDDLADKEKYYPFLHWWEKRESSNGEMAVKKDEMPSEKLLQSLNEDLVVCAERRHPVPFCKVYSRRNRQKYCDDLPKTFLERTSNGNGSSRHMPSDKPELLNEVSIGIAVAKYVEPVYKDSVRSDEQDRLRQSSLRRTPEGNAIPCHVNYLPDASAPLSRPSTAVFLSEVPEASAPLTSMSDKIDVKDETADINLLGEGHAFFANLQPLLDESLEKASQQPSITITLSPDEIMEAKCCLNKYCLMNFEQLMNHAERDQFLSTLDLLLKHGYFPNHMLDMVMNLQLKFSSNKCLYSECQESIRRVDLKREHIQSLKQELTDKYNLHQEIERKIEVVDDKIEKLIEELKEARNLRKSLVDQSKSLKASSVTSYDALCQYKQSSKTLDKCKQTGQQLMKDIDDSWNILRTEILNLVLDM